MKSFDSMTLFLAMSLVCTSAFANDDQGAPDPKFVSAGGGGAAVISGGNGRLDVGGVAEGDFRTNVGSNGRSDAGYDMRIHGSLGGTRDLNSGDSRVIGSMELGMPWMLTHEKSGYNLGIEESAIDFKADPQNLRMHVLETGLRAQAKGGYLSVTLVPISVDNNRKCFPG